MMKTGLVLEGGAMRGMFTAGVLDVLMEKNIAFDGAVGVSAGAVFGCNLKSRQIGRVIRYNKRFCGDWRYCSMRSLLLTGDLYGADFCYRQIPEELDPFDREAYQASPMHFWVVGTDAKTGEAVYHRCDTGDETDMLWFRASASMPMVSRPVVVEGKKLLDGGIADSIPLRFMETQGYERNLVVLTQPEGFVKQPNSLLPVMRLTMRRYPGVIEAVANRHERYNETTAYIARQARAGAVLALYPEHALDVGATEKDPARLQAVYEHGRSVAQKQLADIRAFLKKES